MLRDAGIDVGVFCLAPKTFWQWRKSPLAIDSEDHFVYDTFPNVPKGALPGDYALVRRHALNAARKYAMRWGKPDVIHAHSVFPGVLVAQILSQYWDIPFGLTEHRPSTLQQREYTPRFAHIAGAVHDAAFRITVSQSIADELGRKYGDQFAVSALPVPNEFFEQPLHDRNDDITRFVHVSGLDPWKRVEMTIDAVCTLLDEGLHVSLDIIGGSEERGQELREYVRARGADNSIHLLGARNRFDMPYALDHDVLVLASSTEAGGTVFAEAQSLGMAVIGSATYGGRFMIRPDTGLVVPIDDREALEDAMRKIAKREVVFESERIREIATERFSSQTFASFHIKTYKEAIESYKGRKL